MPRGVTRAAYPRVLLCERLRCRGGGAFVFANLLGEPGRLSPPIWPCTTRGFPCSRYCYRDGGLLPHLFTLAKRFSFSKTSRRFPCAMPPCCPAGGIFSVALSVTEPHRAELSSTPHAEARVTPLCSGACVAVPWRYQARCPCSSPALASLRRRCPDFPPAPIARGQRSPGPPANSIIDRNPPWDCGERNFCSFPDTRATDNLAANLTPRLRDLLRR